MTYYFPLQTPVTTTTTTGEGGSDTWTSYATLYVPISWVITLLLIGVVVFLLGMIFPVETYHTHSPEVSHLVESKEHIETNGKKKRKLIRERREQHVEEEGGAL